MTEKPSSIIKRIAWLHLLALAGLSLAITAAAYLLLNSIVIDFEKRMLQDHAKSVSAHLEFAKGHWQITLPPDLQAIYTRGYGGYALAVIADDGSIIYSSLPNDSPVLTAKKLKASEEFLHQSHGSSAYYGMTMPVTRDGRTAWIQVGQNLKNPDVIVDDVVALFLTQIIWFVIPIFGVLLIIDLLLMRRLLAPIVSASHVARTIGPSSPFARLPTKGLPREILPLAEAVNQGLDRLENSLRAQREFTADAAHELRTPLSILRTHVDTMLDTETAYALQGDIDSMSHIVDQLLELAELDGYTPDNEARIDLNALCADVVMMMAPIAIAGQKSLELTYCQQTAQISGNEEMLFRALRNLVENAIRHTRVQDSIEVEVVAPATVLVKDRGPGIPPAERDLIFRRFWRRDRREKGHAGLGLAIVAKIIQLHNGAITVTDRPGGGAVFALNFPHDARFDDATASQQAPASGAVA